METWLKGIQVKNPETESSRRTVSGLGMDWDIKQTAGLQQNQSKSFFKVMYSYKCWSSILIQGRDLQWGLIFILSVPALWKLDGNRFWFMVLTLNVSGGFFMRKNISNLFTAQKWNCLSSCQRSKNCFLFFLPFKVKLQSKEVFAAQQ